MRLLAYARDLSCYFYVLRLTKPSAKRVAPERVRFRLPPSHDDARVQSACKGDANGLVVVEVPRKASREDLAELCIVRARIKERLLLPFFDLEVSILAVERAVTEDPDRTTRKNMDFVEYCSAPQHAAAGHELSKTLGVGRPELRTPDPQGLGEFVACSCVLGGRTIFNKIHVLPGGSVWVFRNGAFYGKDTYFKIKEWEEQPLLDPSSYYAELCQVLSRSLPRYFNDHEPIGISLTGGLDTRVIMAWRKPEPHSLRS